jgi:hypothetical protein
MDAETIAATHRAHPEWCADEIAMYLDASTGHVRKTLVRRHLTAAPKMLRRRIVKLPFSKHLKP